MSRVGRYGATHAQNLIAALGRLARQPVATGLTMLVIAIALALPAGLKVLVDNVTALSATWQQAAAFSVYLEDGVAAARAAELARELEARDDVEDVELMTRDAALDEFRATSGFGASLDLLEHNPLPHTIVVRPASVAEGDIEALATALRGVRDVALVQVDTEWVARLRAMLALAARAVDLATGLLAIGVVLVIGNTIRLEINHRSTEIEVMKLVGGSDAFIRRPFLYLGFWYGIGGGLVAALLIAAGIALLRGPTAALAELYGSGFRLAGLTPAQTALVVGGGAVLGWAGAGLATVRHLRAIEPR